MPMVAGSPTDLCRLALAGGAFLALACGHTDPFSAPPFGTTQPFDPSPPVRLTLNESADRGASWLPDGSGILYSTQQLGRPDHDVCLAELPATGGSQRRLVCDLSGSGDDSTNAIESPVLSPDGRLAFVKASGRIGAVSPDREAVAVAPGSDVSGAANVQPIPYTIPGEPRHNAVRQLRWQGADRLVFVGAHVAYRVPCQNCVMDTITSGLKLGVLDLSAAGATVSGLPGTDFASGVSRGPTDDEIYFTLGGDSRVFRRVLSTGATDVVYDFGPAGIARDVDAAAGRLAAVVGGRVAFSVDPELGPTQWDSGGIVHVVDLASGADAVLESPASFRRPALSPAGTEVVAEGYPLVIAPKLDPKTGQPVLNPLTGNPLTDTTVARAADLYLFGAP
ncbi:MAG TPA: hypothetical protein VFG66_03680 [Gemmatimonadales bacterium]|nr:hypothetical protein [Gemmatimonadales bacterium]